MVDLASDCEFDKLFFVGENFYKTKTNNQKFSSFEGLKSYLIENPINKSVVLIKGSRGMALERVVALC